MRRLPEIVLALTVPAMLVHSACNDGAGQLTAEDRSEQIISSLPRGTTDDAILAYLDSEGVGHQEPKAAELYPQLAAVQSVEIPSRTTVIEAILPRDDGSAIEVFFIMNENGELDEAVVLELGRPRP